MRSLRVKIFYCFIALSGGAMLFACEKGGNNNEPEPVQEAQPEAIKEKELPPPEYMMWVEDPSNGLRREKTIDDITFTLQYKPAEYVTCREEHGSITSKVILDEKLEELEGMYYFNFKIGLVSGQGELLKYQLAGAQQYNERVNYFAFKMQQEVKLVQDADTIACGLYHFERAYDVAPFSTMLLGFDKQNINPAKPVTFVYEDKIFNKGWIKIGYPAKAFINLPKLELQ